MDITNSFKDHLRRYHNRTYWLLSLGVLVVATCSPDRDSTTLDSVDTMLAWAAQIEIEETPDAMTVWPIVRLDVDGAFLVADIQESQFRRYDRHGRLLARFGSKGRGPEEFERPTVAVRLPSREILVVDRRIKIVLLDPSGTRLVRTVPTPIGAIEDVDVVDDSTLLLSGQAGSDPDSPMLHLWDYRRNKMRGSFFQPWTSYRYKDVAATAGWVQAAIRSDTIAAIFAPSDTVYLFRLDGTHLASIPIPSRHFRSPRPLANADNASLQARRNWLSTFDLVTAVHWAGSEGFLVPYQSFINGRPVWKLLGVHPNGALWFDDPDSPRLLAADVWGQDLVFVAEEAEAPNRWRLASLRRHN